MKGILSLLAALTFVGAASAFEVTPLTKIVIPDMDSTGVGRALKEAANELRLDVEEATGLTPAVVEASKAGDTAGAILIGEKAAAAAGLVPGDLRLFDNVIAEKGGRLYLFGHDRPCRTGGRNLPWTLCILASVKAITDFEYRFMDVRHLMPGRTGTEVPKRAKIEVPDGFLRVSRPRMENGTGRYHGLMYSIANNMFGNATYQTYGGHLYHAAFAGKNFREDHPEYYAVVNGRRATRAKNRPALCVSNPDVKREIVRFMLGEFDRGADVIELGQQDSDEFCQCEKCRAYGGPAAKTVGEKYWIFHRSIAEELYRLRPEKTVQITSYWVTDCRPTTFGDFPPNVMVELMTYSDEVFEAWKPFKVPRGFSIYTYMWGDYQSPGLTCKVSTPVMARIARRFAKNNVRSVYRCGYGEVFGCEGPASYVFNRMLDDPTLDENALFEEYLAAAYGPAAGHMRKFHKALEERVAAWAECFNNNRQWPWPREQTGNNTLCAIYTPAMIQLCEASLAAAERTEGLSAKAKLRLRLVRREWDYTRMTAETCILYDAYRVAPSAPLFEAIAARVEKRRAFVDGLYGDGKRPKPLEGWPEYASWYSVPKEMLLANGRLFAPLKAPFTWNIGAVRKTLADPAAKYAAKALPFAKRNGAPWLTLGGMMLEPAERVTRFRCFYDENDFILETVAELPDALACKPFGHDGKCDSVECLELFIDPFFQRTKCFHFIWNPVADSYYDEAYGLSSDPLDPEADKFKASWNGKWSYKVSRKDNCWRSEVRVPFATLGVAKPQPGTKWYLNVGRECYKDALQTLQLWGPSMSGRGMCDLEAMGTLEFE